MSNESEIPHNNWYVQDATGQAYGPNSEKNCRFAAVGWEGARALTACEVNFEAAERASRQWYVSTARGGYFGPFTEKAARRISRGHKSRKAVPKSRVPNAVVAYMEPADDANVTVDFSQGHKYFDGPQHNTNKQTRQWDE